jgi:hypothetical protein
MSTVNKMISRRFTMLFSIADAWRTVVPGIRDARG